MRRASARRDPRLDHRRRRGGRFRGRCGRPIVRPSAGQGFHDAGLEGCEQRRRLRGASGGAARARDHGLLAEDAPRADATVADVRRLFQNESVQQGHAGERNRHASHHRSRPRRRHRRARPDRAALPPRRRERRHRAGPRRRLHPRRARLARHLDRPRRPRPHPQRARPRAVGSRRRAGLRHHRPHRRPAGVRPRRLGPQRLPGRVHRRGGPQPRPARRRHRPHGGGGAADLRADRLAGPVRPRAAHHRPEPC